MPFTSPDLSKFDLLCKAGELVLGNYIEVGGTMYRVAGIGFNGAEECDIVLRQYADPLDREISIRCDYDQKFGVWTV